MVEERPGLGKRGPELIIPRHIPTTEPPTQEEQGLIRSIIDTSGFYTGWKEPMLAWWGKE
ncbi:MAG: hypothetical protein JRJ65_20940 [Deltaproteobacteria bacterium]|nr:hypothetical protein [Deltaproteobacteria bacterium]